MPSLALARRALTGFLACAMLAGLTVALASERTQTQSRVTASTFLPAPGGVYTRIITTGGHADGMGADTLLAKDNGRVGIRTPHPTATLHVVGSFRLENGSHARNRVLMSDAWGNARWASLPEGTEMPRSPRPCEDPLRPEDSERPCLAPLYRCPAEYTANGASSGSWHHFGCEGQLSMHPKCRVSVGSQTQLYDCPAVGAVAVH